MKKTVYIYALLLLFVSACTKIEELGEAPRLFRPVLKESLLADGNWIKASWQPVKGASSYTAQISTDTFKTIAATLKVDSNVALFENLKWEKLYQVQVRANAMDTSKNSGISSLGAIKTARFPTILNIPALADVNDNSVKVSWTNSGATVTEIRILSGTDSSSIATVAVNSNDVANAYKVISGLKSSTSYIIFLYSGTAVRGWANFSTKASLQGIIIDLRDFTGVPSLLMDTVPDIPSGSIILLKRGETYAISATLSLNKTLTFTAGADLMNPNPPIISFANNFNIVAGSNIDSLVFSDVILRGTDYSSKYVFNINTACNIGKIRFENCLAEIFRGVLRTQSQPVIIGKIEMNNCTVDSVKDYGVINIDVATSRADYITVTNSTVYNTQKFIVSRNNSIAVLVDNCSFNDNPLGNSAYMIDYSTAGTNNVTNGITVNNCIFGAGKNNAGSTLAKDYRANAATVVNASNNFRTSDRISGGGDLPNIITVANTTLELWQNPVGGNFKIIDKTFAGRSSSGDPRWRL